MCVDVALHCRKERCAIDDSKVIVRQLPVIRREDVSFVTARLKRGHDGLGERGFASARGTYQRNLHARPSMLELLLPDLFGDLNKDLIGLDHAQFGAGFFFHHL